MLASSNEAIRGALDVLEREATALEDQLAQVNAAIRAIRPLAMPTVVPAVVPSMVADIRMTAAVDVAPPLAPSGSTYRSPAIAALTAAVERVLGQADRPLTVREISERVAEEGVQPEDSHKLADLLYRKSKPGEMFERVSNGLYALRKDYDGELPLASV